MKFHACFFLFSAVSLPAQAQVIPIGFAKLEGNGALALQQGGPMRHQVIYASPLLSGIGPKTLGAILFRADAGAPTPARTYDLTVWMSSLGVPAPEKASTTSWTANLGSDVAQVVKSRVTFPALTASLPTPEPLAPKVPLARPFYYPGQQNFLIQIDFVPVDNKDPFVWPFDAAVYQTTTWGLTVSTFGKGCPTTGTFGVSQVQGTSHDLVNFNYRFTRSGPTVGGIMTLGLSDRQLGSIRLPLDLKPLGAPGCFVYHDMLVQLPAGLRGGAHPLLTATAYVPRDFALQGLRVFAQALIFEPTVNALGLRMSQGLRVDFATPPSPWLGVLLSGPTYLVGISSYNWVPIIAVE